MSRVPDPIADAYDPERFRREGHAVIDVLADALARAHRREGRALPYVPPAEGVEAWRDVPHTSLVDDVDRIVRGSTALHHPHYMAHQVSPPLPTAILAETVSALLNNGTGVYEMGPVSVALEVHVLRWMCDRMGLPAEAGGVLTSGGSLGNLTALLAMRQAAAGFDVWAHGAQAGPPLAVIVGSDAHYSIARTLRIMGWGDAGTIVAPVDAEHRLRGAAVEAALASAGDRKVVGVVAAAGSTATGSFDPLHELADVAERRGLWLHVDAAHGGGLALSLQHRHRLAGIERADSIVWDMHKLLMLPALVTSVLFKRGRDAYGTFAQQASYLFAKDEAWWDTGTRTVECTKRMMSIEVWTALRAHGESTLAAIVDRLVDLGRELATRVRAAPDFELAIEPACNIVCYRHRPAGLAPGPALDAHNRALRQRCAEDGRFYIVGTMLDGAYWLRSALMNPLTEAHDLDALLAHLRSLCPA